MAFKVTINGAPSVLRKNLTRIAYGKGGKCSRCGKPTGAPYIVQSKLSASVAHTIRDQAFAASVEATDQPVVVGTIAYWPRAWSKKGRAEGRPCGDVDAIVSGLLDALAGILYRDDAQVAVVIAANAKATKGEERIEVVVRPLSDELLAALEEHVGLPFTTARLVTGQQGRLL